MASWCARMKAWIEPADDLCGQCSLLVRIREDAVEVAATDIPVLIEGETGTGKEILARVIHRHSTRAKAPFIPVNCASFNAELIESEIFGHERGAFTGALSGRAGRIAAAHRGTLFLDEIGDLPLPLQGRLLRFLQSGELQRIGRDVPLEVDTRVISATNQPLQEAVRRRSFRADLYYRLFGVHFRMPALRERGDDIIVLAHLFLSKFAQQFSRGRLDLDAGAIELLRTWPWPGNVRELENVMRSVAFFSRDSLIDRAALERRLRADESVAGPQLDGPARSFLQSAPLAPAARREWEAESLPTLLRERRGNLSQVARGLGISRPTLYKRLRDMRIDPNMFRRGEDCALGH
jgi:DNA-binding NtrC family response regulator